MHASPTPSDAAPRECGCCVRPELRRPPAKCAWTLTLCNPLQPAVRPASCDEATTGLNFWMVHFWNRFLDFQTWNWKHSDFNYSVVKLWIKKCENLKKLKMFAYVTLLKYDETCFLSRKLTKLQWIWQNVVQSTTCTNVFFNMVEFWKEERKLI